MHYWPLIGSSLDAGAVDIALEDRGLHLACNQPVWSRETPKWRDSVALPSKSIARWGRNQELARSPASAIFLASGLRRTVRKVRFELLGAERHHWIHSRRARNGRSARDESCRDQGERNPTRRFEVEPCDPEE